MENKLDWELDGVRLVFELNVTAEDCGLEGWKKCVDRGEGVVPYG